jgi:hypothetical protein
VLWSGFPKKLISEFSILNYKTESLPESFLLLVGEQNLNDCCDHVFRINQFQDAFPLRFFSSCFTTYFYSNGFYFPPPFLFCEICHGYKKIILLHYPEAKHTITRYLCMYVNQNVPFYPLISVSTHAIQADVSFCSLA